MFEIDLTENCDALRELRLRRWAREHYVARSQRQKEWHPIVLDEMQIRDAEMVVRAPASNSAFVPLAPTEIRRFDPPHSQIPEPSVARTPSRLLEDAF